MRYSSATLALLVVFACQAEATSQRIEIAPPSGEVGFRAYKLGLLPIDGKFTRFDGWLSFDPDDRTSCRVELRVEVASLQTDDREISPVVTGPDFMDAARFPLLQFAGHWYRPRHRRDACHARREPSLLAVAGLATE